MSFLWDVGDMLYGEGPLCVSGGRQTCRVLFNFLKSKAHLLKIKLVAITSFTSVKNVCIIQVITPWILAATCFL